MESTDPKLAGEKANNMHIKHHFFSLLFLCYTQPTHIHLSNINMETSVYYVAKSWSHLEFDFVHITDLCVNTAE